MNTRIKAMSNLPTPNDVTRHLPVSFKVQQQIAAYRQQIADIIHGRDHRVMMIVGPCSIHDAIAALEYAKRLQVLAASVQENILIVMRTYFEKPRTNLGWTGLISDPHLDGSCDIHYGLQVARQLLIDINQLGVPTAIEWLDTIIPQYLADLVSWAAIGARTTESQIHRHMASGLSMPVGFKNTTSGNIDSAIDAMKVARASHRFLSVGGDGQAIIAETLGNTDCHVVLRGGTMTGPNYSEACILSVKQRLRELSVERPIMVDCSHGNSHKNPANQKQVVVEVCQQLQQAEHAICGLMLESHLYAGQQNLTRSNLQYGVSITDACIDFEETIQLVNLVNNKVRLKQTISV